MKLINKKLILPLFGNTVTSLGWSVFLIILMPTYASLYGYKWENVIPIYAASIALFSFPGGRLSDIFGRKRMIIFGNIINALSPIFIIMGNSFFHLILTAFLFGSGNGLSHSAFHAYIADISKKDKMSSSYGRISAISLVIAAGLTLLIKEVVKYWSSESQQLTYSFIIISTLTWIWAISATRLEDTKPKIQRVKIGIRKAFELFTPKERKIVIDMGIMQMVTGFGAALTVNYYIPYLDSKFDADIQQLFMISIGSILLLSITTFISGEIGIKARKLRFIQMANLLAIPMALGIINSPLFLFAAIFYIFRNSMANMIWPLWSSFSMGNIRKEMRGAANGFGAMVWNLVYIPASAIGQTAMDWTNGWTIPLAAVMYASVTAYVRWHLKEFKES